MNVLDKILKEIKHEAMTNKEIGRKQCEGMARAMIIICSHMDEISDVCGKRLIDANLLDNEVMNFFLAITGNPKQTTVVRECKEAFRRMIDEQPTVNVDDDWIPVEERLPEIGENNLYRMNLVTLEGVEVCLGVYRNLENEWWTRRQEGENSYTTAHKVAAWQPLPEPYKPEEK